MANLAAQHVPLQSQLEAAALRVLRSGRFILGDEVAAFEGELAAACGVAHAVGMSSGSDALVAILTACRIGPGHEVVTTPFSFFATAEAVLRVGATPVFVDIDPSTLNIDAAAVGAGVGSRTRAILAVHLFGRMADMVALDVAASATRLAVIEDAAQAIGATLPDGRGPGIAGVAAALSLFPAKNLGAFGDAGMVLTGDSALANRVRAVRVHGARVPHVHDVVGGNYRLDELQAALLRVKLPSLDMWTRRRRDIARRYRQAWAELPVALPPDDPGCVWSQFVVRVAGGRREVLAAHLTARGIDTAVFYPTPLHLQPALERLGGRPGQLPHAEAAARDVLALPVHAQLSDDDVERVCDEVQAFFAGR
jgi:dTDP-4-amino-4,6-dideoxygalactose transaminase